MTNVPAFQDLPEPAKRALCPVPEPRRAAWRLASIVDREGDYGEAYL